MPLSQQAALPYRLLAVRQRGSHLQVYKQFPVVFLFCSPKIEIGF